MPACAECRSMASSGPRNQTGLTTWWKKSDPKNLERLNAPSVSSQRLANLEALQPTKHCNLQVSGTFI